MAQPAILPKRPGGTFTSPLMRHATRADVPALAALWRAARPEGRQSEATLKEALEGGWALLLEDEHGAALAALHYREEAGGWRAEPIVTHPQHRGQGYGRWLMTTLEANAIRGNVPFLLLTLDNAATLPYYHRLGYRSAANDELNLSKRVGGMWQRAEVNP